jgi:hypothetical protein
LAANNNLQIEQVSQAKACIAGMPSGSVDALEIGNEPDNYASNGMKSSTYTTSDYLTEFSKWKTNILTSVPSSTKFMGESWGSMLTLHDYMSSFDNQELSSVPTFSLHAYAEYPGDAELSRGLPLEQPTSAVMLSFTK